MYVVIWGHFVEMLEIVKGPQFRPLLASLTLVPQLVGEELWPP